MYIRRTAIVPRYVKGGSNIFTDAFKKVRKLFKRHGPKALKLVKQEGIKLAKKHGPKLLEKGGEKLLQLAMGKISNLAGGNIIPVMKPSISSGRGIKYV